MTKSRRMKQEQFNKQLKAVGVVVAFVILGIAAFFVKDAVADAKCPDGAYVCQFDTWVTLHEPDELPEELQEKTVNAVLEFGRKHLCGRAIDMYPRYEDRVMLDAGRSVVEYASADVGIIYISPTTPLSEARQLTLHETAHACIDEQMPVAEPFMYKGFLVIAYEGFSFVLQSPEGELLAGYIEEAYAERQAYQFPGYSKEYHQLYMSNAAVFVEAFPYGDQNTEGLMFTWHRTSNLPALIGALLGKPEDEVTPADMIRVMDEYAERFEADAAKFVP